MNSDRTMITFKTHDTKFTYRVGGIVVHNEQVLFQRGVMEDLADTFWFLPGGRAELNESAEETLRREMREELAEEIQIERLLYVNENFFQEHALFHHELGLYFLMTLPTTSHLLQEPGPFVYAEEAGRPMIFDWLPLAQMAELPVQPQFLKQALLALPPHITHIVHMDKQT